MANFNTFIIFSLLMTKKTPNSILDEVNILNKNLAYYAGSIGGRCAEDAVYGSLVITEAITLGSAIAIPIAAAVGLGGIALAYKNLWSIDAALKFFIYQGTASCARGLVKDWIWDYLGEDHPNIAMSIDISFSALANGVRNWMTAGNWVKLSVTLGCFDGATYSIKSYTDNYNAKGQHHDAYMELSQLYGTHVIEYMQFFSKYCYGATNNHPVLGTISTYVTNSLIDNVLSPKNIVRDVVFIKIDGLYYPDFKLLIGKDGFDLHSNSPHSSYKKADIKDKCFMVYRESFSEESHNTMRISCKYFKNHGFEYYKCDNEELTPEDNAGEIVPSGALSLITNEPTSEEL